MKKLHVFLPAALLAVLTACTDASKTEVKADKTIDSATTQLAEEIKTPKKPMDSAAMAEAWADYMTPGEMHKWLAEQDGKWSCEMISWPSPGAMPVKANDVSSESRMILGGRYQEISYRGTMMGMPFEGRSLMGYDNARKKFFSTWVDNLGTGITYTEGPYNAADKSITLEGTMVDPVTGKDIRIKQIFRYIDARKSVLELYTREKGKEDFKNMEIRMTKK